MIETATRTDASILVLSGLKAGDIITRLNGVELNSENNLSALLSAYNPGDSVTVNYLRNGVSAETEVLLGSIQK